MRRISVLAFSLVCVGLFTIGAFAQAQPGSGKIGWIDTGAFADEKEGVTKYVTALKSLDAEMKPRVAELTGLQDKLKTISADLQKMTAANPSVPVDPKAAQSKQDEGERLQLSSSSRRKNMTPPLKSAAVRCWAPCLPIFRRRSRNTPRAKALR